MRSLCVNTIVLILFFSISQSPGLEWEIEVVDSSGEVIDAGTSISLNSKNYPHISYISYFAQHDSVGLAYAHWNGTQWQKQMVYRMWIYFSTQTSLCLDSEDNPHIAHGWHGGLGALMMYSCWNSTGWEHMHIPNFGEGVHNDIVVDDSGCAHIAHVWTSDIGSPVSPLYNVFGCSKSCETIIDTLEESWLDGAVSIDLRNSGLPCVCYNLNTWLEPGLKYAYCDGDWHVEQADTVPRSTHTSGTAISMELDISDHSHVSYYDDLNQNLKWARKRGANWHIGGIDTTGDVGVCNSLILDAYGFEHISYYDATNKDLKCAHWNGLEWEREGVDTLGEVGDVNSIAIDSEGCLHISYYDASNQYLKYARSESVHICEGDKGDVDGSGTVDVIDVVFMVRHILEDEVLALCDRIAADCNSDGIVDVIDVIGVVNVVLGVGRCPPGN